MRIRRRAHYRVAEHLKLNSDDGGVARTTPPGGVPRSATSHREVVPATRLHATAAPSHSYSFGLVVT